MPCRSSPRPSKRATHSDSRAQAGENELQMMTSWHSRWWMQLPSLRRRNMGAGIRSMAGQCGAEGRVKVKTVLTKDFTRGKKGPFMHDFLLEQESERGWLAPERSG